MRIKCEKLPLCYDFSNIEAYLNRAEVVEALGASGSWQSCNMVVNKLFMADFMTSYHKGTLCLQLNKYETGQYFLQKFLTMSIHVFCKICEYEIVLQEWKSKQKQCQVHNSHKTCE